METSAINYWAVLVAGVAYMFLGAIWYSPILFGGSWMKGVGKTKEQLEKDFTPVNYLWGFVTALMSAYGIARIMLWMGGNSINDGIMLALMIGINFVLASFWVNDAFESRPKYLTIINALYHQTGLVIVGVIIGAWR